MIVNLKIVLQLMICKHANCRYNKYKCICLSILTNLSGTLCLNIVSHHAKDKIFRSTYATLVHFHKSEKILITLADCTLW